ncbi:MAG: hypothetical protein AMJ81_03920 [Phycisphaerae bacterium SM23_33]|jgi:RNA polymerase primary sigma factor|nr:MAG: hypothetical protein AMJ81_03920 [Phycisphaerae bacterium SM23_33]
MASSVPGNGSGENRWQAPKGLDQEERRLYEQIPSRVEYVYHRSFSSPSAAERLFGRQREEINVPPYTLFPEVPEETVPKSLLRNTLNAKDEVAMFLRYNYAKHRVSKLLAARRGTRALKPAREMITWYGRVLSVRTKLVRANLALVPAMAKRARLPNVEFGDLISEGNMAVLRSIEKFDVSRGFKFSTYACRSIVKSFNRLATKARRYRKHFPVQFVPELERSDYEQQRHIKHQADSIDTLREILIRNHAHLDQIEWTVIMQRFPIMAQGKGRTLAEVGKIVGLTNERVRQIEKRAFSKIREVFQKRYFAA